MSEPTHRKLRGTPGAGRVSDDAFERGQALYRLILKLGYEPVSFAAESKIHVSTLWMYIHGRIDLAQIKQPSVEKLLIALAVTDTWAWSYFKIPQELRTKWRTFRPPPLGHGEDPRELYELKLDRSTTGRYVLWPNDVLTLDPGNKTVGLMLARAGEQYVLNGHELLPPEAEIMGQVVRIEPAILVTGPESFGPEH